MASRAKKLKKNGGYASKPPRKKGKKLPDEVVNKVRDYYHSEDVSRIQPGMNDCKSVSQNGSKTLEQKRLILFNIKELYSKFKEENPELKISLSSFHKLKPQECIPAGKNSTHNVCVCKTHQNFKMKINRMKMELIKVDINLTEDYHDFIKNSVYASPTPHCYFSNCQKCPFRISIPQSKIISFIRKK